MCGRADLMKENAPNGVFMTYPFVHSAPRPDSVLR